MPEETKKTTNTKTSTKSNKWIKRIAVLLLLVFGFIAIYRVMVVATVNGRPIYRHEILQELEKQGGEQMLEQMITRHLIFQEMAKNNVLVADEEIEAEINKLKESIKGQGLTFEQALEFQGMNEEDLRTNIRIQKGIEALLADKIMVTDEEVQEYYEENSPDATFESLSESIAEQLKQEKLQSEYQAFIEELRNQASINNVISY
jgi:foldase protein PrsA